MTALRRVRLAIASLRDESASSTRGSWDHYGSDATRVATAQRDLETYVLGRSWRYLTHEEQQFLATAEVFWKDHAGAANMDFGPVVIEIAKAVESLIRRRLVEPFLTWCTANGREPGRLGTVGDVRAELERAATLLPGQTRPRGARTLADYVIHEGMANFLFDDVLELLNRLNPIRRQAAHPHEITSSKAAEARAWLIGVGSDPSAISRLAESLAAPG